MKKILFTLAFVSTVFATDEELLECLGSEEFVNKVVMYQYDRFEHPIRVIYNPKDETLWGEGFSGPNNFGLIVVGNLPMRLRWHIDELFSEHYREADKVTYSLDGENDPYGYDTMHPVHIATEIVDPVNDEGIRKAYQSATFVNEVYYYCLNGTYYQVRVLYNPEGRKFEVTKNYKLDIGTKAITTKWDYRYGIFTDKKAPNPLFDHLLTLINYSYWEYYTNFDIQNGKHVVHQLTDYGYFVDTTTTWTLDSWFKYGESFR